jgi:hypothetical protein
LKNNSSAVLAYHTTLIQASAVVGCVTTTVPAVSHIYTGLHIVIVGNLASALILPNSSILVELQSFQPTRQIPNFLSYQADTLASTNSHLLSLAWK